MVTEASTKRERWLQAEEGLTSEQSEVWHCLQSKPVNKIIPELRGNRTKTSKQPAKIKAAEAPEYSSGNPT